jgi:sigma-E factor negative regulatory protein RseA
MILGNPKYNFDTNDVMEKMDTNKKIREHISALCDGELPTGDTELAFAGLQAPDGHHAWDIYHHIGDALRAAPSRDLSDGFAERLAARLAAEPMPGRRRAEPRTEPDTTRVAATASRA